MLPPHEIKTKGFTHALRGYSAAEVDEYADLVLREYTELYRENDALETRISELEGQLEKLREDEGSIRDALVDANRRSAEIVDEANERARIILHSAKLNCDRILSEFRSAVKEERDELLLLRGMVKKFKEELFLSYQTHIEYIEKIAPELDSLDESEFSDEAIIRLAVESIKGDILEGDAPEEETVISEDAPIPAETESLPVAEQESRTDSYEPSAAVTDGPDADPVTDASDADAYSGGAERERDPELDRVISELDLSDVEAVKLIDTYEQITLDAVESLSVADDALRSDGELDAEREMLVISSTEDGDDTEIDEFLLDGDSESDVNADGGEGRAELSDDDDEDYLKLLSDITGQ